MTQPTGSLGERRWTAATALPELQKTSLGRKGQMTRGRLMDAAAKLLDTISPSELTVATVAKSSGVSNATFYQYFEDVRGVLQALCDRTTRSLIDAFERSDLFLQRAAIEEDSFAFLDMLAAAWDQHGNLLNYRNMEADRGDNVCSELRAAWSRAVIFRLCVLMHARSGATADLSFEDIGAEALVIFAAMERLAAAVRREPISGLGAERIRNAQVRVLVRSVRSLS